MGVCSIKIKECLKNILCTLASIKVISIKLLCVKFFFFNNRYLLLLFENAFILIEVNTI